MEVEKISTIPLIAHENYVSRLYKVIRLLIIAIIVLCIAFSAYIGYDRYLDTTTTDSLNFEQNANDNGQNAYAGGDYVVSENNN